MKQFKTDLLNHKFYKMFSRSNKIFIRLYDENKFKSVDYIFDKETFKKIKHLLK